MEEFNGFEQSKERIGKLENRTIVIIQFGEQKEKRMKKSEHSPSDPGTPSRIPTYMLWELQKNREKGSKRIVEKLMVGNFSNLIKGLKKDKINLYIQEAQQISK